MRALSAISVCVTVLSVSSGCMSHAEREARSWEERPPIVYPGVRGHILACSEILGFGDEHDPHLAFGRYCYVVFFPFILADSVILTPALDTVLLPYDLVRIARYERLAEESAQQ